MMEFLNEFNIGTFEVVIVLMALKDIVHFEYLYRGITEKQLDNHQVMRRLMTFFIVSIVLTAVLATVNLHAAAGGWLIAVSWEFLTRHKDKQAKRP